ncbi:alpha/beta fold hydrolase [Streptomyces sp. NPDC002187]|uniref:alpha/beta fold hydrolase n=1 Tax=Streptomyces sp. NPDC002187 TaxID=3364637 RepID=UPI00369E27B0
MGTFRAHDGTELAYHLMGEGEPLICLPGGPMRASAYYGDLGGLSGHRQLVLLDLRGTGESAVPADPESYRCDRQVDDVEALRAHLGLEQVDLLAHSAAGNLALLYAARRPRRVRSLTLVTPGTGAAGIGVTDEDRREAVEARAAEPWYPAGRAAFEEVWGGRPPGEVRSAIQPFMYGRWDEAAQAHAAATEREINWAAAEAYYAEGAFDPPATVAALAAVDVPVLVLAGELDGGPRPARAAELADLFPSGETVVQTGAAHYPWLDDPGVFTRTVAAFLDPAVHTVHADGVRLAYRVWGEPSAPPLVLVHGRGGSSADWTHIAGQLARTRRVYALDLRGHGLSDWPGGYGFDVFRDDLSAFVRALGIGPVDVIGHSMGAAAALLLAEEQPDLVARLVLEETAPLVPLDPPRGAAQRPAEPLGFDWPVVPSIDAQLNAPDPAWRDRLGAVRTPTLVMAGGTDSHIDQEQLKELARLIPGACLATIDAGHLVHHTAPEEFLGALKEIGIQ